MRWAQLMHRLFGWHYVWLRYGFSDYARRVEQTASGRRYVRMCDDTIFLDSPGYHRIVPITFVDDTIPNQMQHVL